VKRVDAERTSFVADRGQAAGNPSAIRVVICDAHRVFAEALASLLQAAGHDIVGCAAEPGEAARVAGRQQADACLLDLGPFGSVRHFGIEQAMACAPGTRFIALAASADATSLDRAVAAGVHGVALKGDNFGEILRVLTTAVSGCGSGRPPSAAVLSQCAEAALRSGSHDGHRSAQFLTAREHEALARLVRGESTTSMAKSMGVRVSTARTHIDAVLTKLLVHSRLEAVALAVREGLVDVDELADIENSDDWSRVVAG
jgi:two-component system nitrate/nitrite response regulator NarL